MNFTDARLRLAAPERVRKKRAEEAARLEIVRLVERELIPWLWDADERTPATYARVILTAPERISEGVVLMLRDRLTGELPDHRWRDLGHVDRPSAYIYAALRWAGLGNGSADYYAPDWPYDPDERRERWQEDHEDVIEECRERGRRNRSSTDPDPRYARFNRNDPELEALLAYIRAEQETTPRP